jgi:energy-coupling factor transporter ATP-binding protein EcfA2
VDRHKSRSGYGIGFFPRTPGNPVSSIIAEMGNRAVNLGLQKFTQETAKRLGLTIPSLEDQIRLNRSRLSLTRQETEFIKAKALSERQLRLLDLKIEDKQIEVERARSILESVQAQAAQLQLPISTEIISGALEVTADPKGLTGSPEQSEAYNRWLDGFQEGKVVLIVGRRGSGKSVLAAKMGEYMMATYRMPCYWVGLPDQAKALIPSWIKIVDDPHKCPVNSFIICDEAGINFLSLLFNSDRNRFLRALLMVCRQRHCSLVFAVQSTTDIDVSVVRQADSLVFKQPGLHQPETERQNIRSRARQAALAFSAMTREEALESAFIFDDDFEGIIKSTPPSFWSEDLSHIYAHLDLAAIEQQGVRRNELQRSVVNETHQLSEASLDSKILELRKEHGIDAIARILGCSQYRVRKCLEGIDGRAQ